MILVDAVDDATTSSDSVVVDDTTTACCWNSMSQSPHSKLRQYIRTKRYSEASLSL